MRKRPASAARVSSSVHEIALIIQDRSFAPDGSLTYPVSELAGSADHPGPWLPEFFGDTTLVNGRVWRSSQGGIDCE